MDRISKLPAGIIETILCLLPIQEAARTSILSREWRYHWIKIPKLEFNERTFEFEVSTDVDELSVLEQTFRKPSKRKEMDNRCKLFYAIYQVLLMHEGPIHEFTLSMTVDDSCVEIDHILLHLSKKNTVKILKLNITDWDREYMLPISVFSLHQLTELRLNDCIISHEPSFSAFGCHTTLYMKSIWTEDKTLLRFLSSCPSLKRLTLNSHNIFYSSGGRTIVDLFKCLPLIEYFSAWFHTFEMEDVDWSGEDELDPSFTLEDYSDIMFEQLNELEVRNFSDADFELDFVIFVLARSPMLEKVTIFTFRLFDEDEAAAISNILLCSPCASPMVKISVEKFRSV